MIPTPALQRKMLFLLCGAAVLSCDANAQNTFAARGADENCASWLPSTISCVRKYMITDSQLSEATASNSPAIHLEKVFSTFSAPDPVAYAAAKQRLSGILQHAESQSAEMGITPPDMYVSMIATQADQTTAGRNYILLNKDAFSLAVLADDGAEWMKIGISRELAHIRNGDTAPAAMVKLHNDPASSREAALRADLEGAGPLGVRDPIAATAAIENDLRAELHKLAFVKGNLLDDLDPNRLSDRDYKRISDEHTRIYNDPHTLAAWDRVVALRKEARLMAEYEQTHAVRTHSDREAESKWLVAQILRDTK